MKRIGILVVAYNAASTLAQVLDRIPRDFVPRISEILVCDDFSQDSTYLVGLGYQQVYKDLPVKVVRRPQNLGYGGNQKAGYRWAIESGLDIVVMLHGDGQYAPEALPQVVEPLELDKCDAVFGSRMLLPGAARLGGMPLYKYVGNRILTRFQNAVAGMELSEWHSGYRAYSVATLREIPFERNSDDFDFDTQIIVQLNEAGKRIEEVAIPTFYGDEISRVNGLRYARDISLHTLRYRAHKMGFGSGEMAFASRAYERKVDTDTSHGRMLSWLADRPPGRVLDLGCSDGSLAAELRTHGHHVTGVDIEEHPGVVDRVDAFVAADLDDGVPDPVGDGFDVIVAADVLEHVREPEQLLISLAGRLAPGGSIVTCVPNFGHWYPRLRVALGRFDYDRRGILDRDHVRFFTRKSLERMVDRTGYSVRRREFLTLPVEVVRRGGAQERAGAGEKALRAFQRIDRIGTALRPTLFAYQFLYELEPTRT
jgi:glycosyltransferase involved in cell wall biosynthesis